MGKLVLFMLNPWREDHHQGLFYCPDCGVVEGFFAYTPEVRKEIEIISIDFERPRHRVIDYLGEDNQSCPVLVLDEDVAAPDGAKKSFTTGRAFIDDPILICDYLGERFNSVRPHPQ